MPTRNDAISFPGYEDISSLGEGGFGDVRLVKREATSRVRDVSRILDGENTEGDDCAPPVLRH